MNKKIFVIVIVGLFIITGIAVPAIGKTPSTSEILNQANQLMGDGKSDWPPDDYSYSNSLVIIQSIYSKDYVELAFKGISPIKKFLITLYLETLPLIFKKAVLLNTKTNITANFLEDGDPQSKYNRYATSIVNITSEGLESVIDFVNQKHTVTGDFISGSVFMVSKAGLSGSKIFAYVGYCEQVTITVPSE